MTSARVARRPPPYNPARELAVRVLLRVLEGEAFAAPALDRALSQASLPHRDAGLATHIVYGVLRHHRSLTLALAPLLISDTHSKVRALLLAGAFEKVFLGTRSHAVVNEYVNLARGARLAPAGLVNAVLRRVQSPEPTSELPDWLEQTYRWAFGGQADAVMADLLQPQPLWLSVSERGAGLLLEEGSELTGERQGIERVELGRPLRESAAYQLGQVQPINPASMACVSALGPVDGQQVYDLAGGSGIKAALLAASGAKVTSVDVVPRKHEAARQNLRRLGLSAEFLTHDLTQRLDLPPTSHVLLDAPCTGSGTLRSHPEIKLRLTPGTVNELMQLQARMLPHAAALVQPGGALVYSVCSVTPQEGPQVVEQFLATRSDFQPEPIREVELPHLEVGAGLLTLPLNGIDGFFIARLRRR